MKPIKQFIRSVFPKVFFTNPAYFRALVLGVLYLGIALSQLFTYEKFAGVLGGYGLPGGQVAAQVLAVLLPLATCAALPFLLSMRMSTVLAKVSAAAVVAAPVLWLLMAIWANFAPNASKLNTGIFGATLAVPVGLWFVVFTLLWAWAAILVVRELPVRK